MILLVAKRKSDRLRMKVKGQYAIHQIYTRKLIPPMEVQEYGLHMQVRILHARYPIVNLIGEE